MNKDKNKLIPALRFPEFVKDGEWEEKVIADFSNSESSSMALNKLEIKRSGYPVYGADSIVACIDDYQQEEKYISIDKDWVLGRFIDAMYSIPVCRDNLVFKGGTCLRKCYFPNYRFSEDLDFTSRDANFVLDKKTFTQITDLITSRTDVPLHIQEIVELRFKDQFRVINRL